MKKMKQLFTVLLIITCMVILSTNVFAEDSEWYKSISLPYGTTLTRDFTFGLTDEIIPAAANSTKNKFFASRSELPDEIPLFAPYNDEEIAASANKIYIAPDGDDRNPGTIDKPVKTFERATKLAEKPNMKKGGLTIYFREGTYSSENGFVTTVKLSGSKDNPVFISAYPGETVKLSVGCVIRGSDLKPVTDNLGIKKIGQDVRDKIYSVDLNSLGYTEFDEITETFRPALYQNGIMYTIARWPNNENAGMIKYTGDDGEDGMIDIGDVLGRSLRGKAYTGDTGNGFEYVMSSSRPLTWENTGKIWMEGYWLQEWDHQHRQVLKFDEEKMSVKSMRGTSGGAQYQSEKSYFFYNVLEELDSPGEWFLDTDTGVMYIYPLMEIKDDDELVITISTNDGLVLQNSSYVVVNGLTVDTVPNYGIYVNNGRYSIIQNCHIKNTGNYAVRIGDSKNCGIISSIAEGDVIVTPNRDLTYANIAMKPTLNFVQNNIVTKQIRVAYGWRDIISHNLSVGAPYMNIYLQQASEYICEYNEIVGGPWERDDSGMIYNGSTPEKHSSHIRYNYLNKHRNQIRTMPYGIYFDDMTSHHYAYGNILREALVFLHGGSNHAIYNNIIVDNTTNRSSVGNSENYHITKAAWQTAIAYNTLQYTGMDIFPLRYESVARYPTDYEYYNNMIRHQYEIQNGKLSDKEYEFAEYVTTPKNNWYENNLLFNSAPVGKVNEINLVCENNIELDYDPGFEDYKNGIYNLTEEEIKTINPNMEPLPPQEKMGVVYAPELYTEKQKLTKTRLVRPLNSEDNVLAEVSNIGFEWTPVLGKCSYRFELSDTPDFSNIVFQKDTETENVTVPELSYDTTYYWRVTTETWTHQFDMTPSVSDISVFSVGSKEYIMSHFELDTFDAKMLIRNLADVVLDIKEDYDKDYTLPEDERVYITEPVEPLNKFIEEAEGKIKELKLKEDMDRFVKETTKGFYVKWAELIRENSWDYVKNLPNPEDWTTVGDGVVVEKEGTGIKVTATKSSDPMIMSKDKMLIRPNTKYKVKLKFDELNAWATLNLAQLGNTANLPTQANSYFVVYKPDLIELQRYLKDKDWKNGILQERINDRQVVDSGQWHIYEYMLTYTHNGPRIVFSIDGKQIFDYTDSTATNFLFDSLGFKHSINNGVMHFDVCE